MSILYIVVIGIEARRVIKLQWLKKIIIVLIWQTPAILCVLSALSGFFAAGLTDYAIFILQFWFTPLTGLLSLTGVNIVGDKPLYYYLLLFLPSITALYYLILSSININFNKRRIFA